MTASLMTRGLCSMTVVDAGNGSYKVLQNLPTQHGALTMALDRVSGTLYAVTAQSGPRPAAAGSNPQPRPAIVPDSYTVIVAERS